MKALKQTWPVRLRLKFFLAAAVVLLGLLAYDFMVGIIWDGKFSLDVHLVPKGDREIIGVFAQPLMQKEWAEELRLDPRRLELDLQPVAGIEGKPFTVRVPSSGTRSAFGREVSYSQFQLLVLRVEYADGTSAYVTAEIPDGRVQRELSVEVP